MTPITAEIHQISYRESEVARCTFLLPLQGTGSGSVHSVSLQTATPSIATDCVKS